MKKKIKISLIVLLLCVLTGCRGSSGIVWEETAKKSAAKETDSDVCQDETEDFREDTAAESEPQRASVTVDICGAVARPGVYVLEEGARVCDAVVCAGGLLADADRAALNQAALLHDADKVIVYTREEVQNGAAGVPAGETGEPGGQAKVNINTADAAQLCTLRGIGQSRAQDIIAYRTLNGAFQTIEEIMNVDGIKEATFTKIKDNISVG